VRVEDRVGRNQPRGTPRKGIKEQERFSSGGIISERLLGEEAAESVAWDAKRKLDLTGWRKCASIAEGMNVSDSILC
jgi:hypothetical protein